MPKYFSWMLANKRMQAEISNSLLINRGTAEVFHTVRSNRLIITGIGC